jgi:hypothetical protein
LSNERSAPVEVFAMASVSRTNTTCEIFVDRNIDTPNKKRSHI